MKTSNIHTTSIIAISIALLTCSPTVAFAEEDYWKMARAASCEELIDAYKTTVEAERKIVAAIKDSRNSTIATNVLGVATLVIARIGPIS